MDDYTNIWSSGRYPSSYSGGSIFARHNPDIARNYIANELFPSLITYQKFKAAKRPRIYNPYFVRTLRKVIQSDIIFMRDPVVMRKSNSGYQYILIVQDTFSRKIWAKPLKTKQGREVRLELNKILRELSPFHKDARFIIDRGTEYLNPEVRAMLDSHGLTITHPSDGHAAHVERANLSLQRILFQHMHEKGGKYKWLSFLPQAVNIMNDRYHRIIKMTPNQAEQDEHKDDVNEAMSLYRSKALQSKKKRVRFSVGDNVRIKRDKNIFSRGYLPTFTDEVFKVIEVLDHLPIEMYRITEWDGTEITGNFYPEELSLVKGDVFKIEKRLKSRTVRGRKEIYVKWEGFPNKYNQWIPLSDLR